VEAFFCQIQFLHGLIVTITLHHSAVKAILGTPNLSRQHARWWTKLYGSGIKRIEIVHRAGIQNQHADVLSQQPTSPATLNAEVQVAQIFKGESSGKSGHITEMLRKDPDLVRIVLLMILIILYLLEGVLSEPEHAANTVAQSSLYTESSITLARQQELLYLVDYKMGIIMAES